MRSKLLFRGTYGAGFNGQGGMYLVGKLPARLCGEPTGGSLAREFAIFGFYAFLVVFIVFLMDLVAS